MDVERECSVIRDWRYVDVERMCDVIPFPDWDISGCTKVVNYYRLVCFGR